MEKMARKPSGDPVQERLRQNKANWNRDISSLVNDLIHFKKMMNGWPSKFFRERSKITEPIPADPATIIGSLAGDFQDLANRANGIIREQIEYSKNRKIKQPKPVANGLAPSKPDLTQQLGQSLTAASKNNLIKLGVLLEHKYLLVEASNPFSRFITRLFNPKIGFGEGARIRRLRLTMLDNCVKSYKELKKLHKEIVKSSKESIINSHKIMTLIWNYWNAVNRLLSTYKAIKPDPIKDDGGKIENQDLKEEKKSIKDVSIDNQLALKIKDYRDHSAEVGNLTSSQSFRALNALIEKIMAAPAAKKVEILQQSNFIDLYAKALQEVNTELNTAGQSFAQVLEQVKEQSPEGIKQAQLLRWVGKSRHQALPGATSGTRLEIYRFISQIKLDLDVVMNLLEQGFDQEQLTLAMSQVNRQLSTLRTMMRSLYYSEKPEEASSFF